MNTTTLRGVFPEPKPVHRKNFMRENIRHLKSLQGVQQDRKLTSQTLSHTNRNTNKYKNIPSRVYSNLTAHHSKIELEKHAQIVKPASIQNKPPFRRPNPRTTWHSASSIEQKSQAVQTERQEDVAKMYETGKIKYSSLHSHNTSTPRPKKTPRKHQDAGGDVVDKLASDVQKIDLDNNNDKNYIKRNMKSIKPKEKHGDAADPLQPPPSYQKGVVPKYLKEKRVVEEETKQAKAAHQEYEGESMAGLVLLPDEERKEYLRVARENYAALIKELNGMPVRNDTLKRRKRKIEIEDELKRLDGVIKIFQKPKVFVKADV